MKVSGFYMMNGQGVADVKRRTKFMFKREIEPLINTKFGSSSISITEAIRTKEYDENNELKAYDVHFILDLPNLLIEDFTEPFYELERIVCTGLRILDVDDYLKEEDREELIMKNKEKTIFKVPVTWEVYGSVEVEATSKEEAIDIVRKDEDDMPLPTESYYVDGSFRLSSDDMEELKAIMD